MHPIVYPIDTDTYCVMPPWAYLGCLASFSASLSLLYCSQAIYDEADKLTQASNCTSHFVNSSALQSISQAIIFSNVTECPRYSPSELKKTKDAALGLSFTGVTSLVAGLGFIFFGITKHTRHPEIEA